MSAAPTNFIVAFPSDAPGGLDAELSGHFGHCDVFTLVTIGENGIEKTEVVAGIPHEHGGCMAPVNLLAGHGARVLIAAGMGRRPLLGFAEVGIDVFHCGDATTVGEAVFAFLAGRLPQFDVGLACGGHHH